MMNRFRLVIVLIHELKYYIIIGDSYLVHSFVILAMSIY